MNNLIQEMICVSEREDIRQCSMEEPIIYLDGLLNTCKNQHKLHPDAPACTRFEPCQQLYQSYPPEPCLHVSFDTKLACSFLYVRARDYAEMSLFAVNNAHFCIIHMLTCKSALPFHKSHQTSHLVLSPVFCSFPTRCGVLPVSVDKC